MNKETLEEAAREYWKRGQFGLEKAEVRQIVKNNGDIDMKCECERPDDNTCNYCDERESLQILQEAATKYSHDWHEITGLDPDNISPFEVSIIDFQAGAKWQAERMYSEEEVIKIVEKSRETGLTAEFLILTEQFKKK